MKSFGHDDGVAVTHDADEFRLIRIRIDKLHAKRWRRHVVIDVKLLKDRRVLMRRPTGPMTWLRSRKAGQNASRFHILSEGDVYRPRVRRPTGFEPQRSVLLDISITNNLQR